LVGQSYFTLPQSVILSSHSMMETVPKIDCHTPKSTTRLPFAADCIWEYEPE